MSLKRSPASLTIANGATVSSTYDTGSATRGCFQLPAAFTGVNCAVHGSIDGATFTQVQVDTVGESATLTVAANGTYSFPSKTFNYPFVRLVVDAQAAVRTVTLFSRDDS